MAKTSTATWVVGLLLALFAAGGAVVFLGFVALGAGTWWALGTGTQHPTARVIGEGCENAVLFRPDDDGGADEMLASVLIRQQEAERGRPMSAREKRDFESGMAWVMPTDGAWCGRGDGGAGAINLAAGGRMLGWLIDLAGSDSPSVTFEGHTFLKEPELLIGAVDGTLVAGNDEALVAEVVAALVAKAAPASPKRDQLEKALADGDLAGFGLTDEAVPFRVAFDARSAGEVRIDGAATQAPTEFESAETMQAVCDGVFGAIPPDARTCEAHREGAEVKLTATVTGADALLGAALAAQQPE